MHNAEIDSFPKRKKKKKKEKKNIASKASKISFLKRNPTICQNWTILCWIILHPLNKGLYNMPNPQEYTILTLLISKVSSKVHPRAQRTLNIDFQDSPFVPIFILNLIPLKMLSPLFLSLSISFSEFTSPK